MNECSIIINKIYLYKKQKIINIIYHVAAEDSCMLDVIKFKPKRFKILLNKKNLYL